MDYFPPEIVIGVRRVAFPIPKNMMVLKETEINKVVVVWLSRKRRKCAWRKLSKFKFEESTFPPPLFSPHSKDC